MHMAIRRNLITVRHLIWGTRSGQNCLRRGQTDEIQDRQETKYRAKRPERKSLK